MAKTYIGVAPSGGGWRKIQSIFDDDGSEWDLWTREGNEGEWVSKKLVAKKPMKKKANFFINHNDYRFAYNHDLATMTQHRKNLLNKVSDIVGLIE